MYSTEARGSSFREYCGKRCETWLKKGSSIEATVLITSISVQIIERLATATLD